MSHLIPQLIIIGLGAAVSPIALTVLIVVMAKNNARRNSLLFLLGFTLTLLAIGLFGVSAFHFSDAGSNTINGYIDLVLAFVCFGFAAQSYIKKGEKKRGKIGDDIKPPKAIALGSIFMVTNPSTFVIYISGLHVIGSAKLKIEQSLLSLALLTLVTLSSLIIPIIIFFLFPKKSQKTLDSLKNWLGTHRKAISITILAAIGLWLLYKGINIIFIV